jgi:cyanocobalamin reductase (cyanide-eliminating) / alkylcobalamin dealkylase
MGAIECPIEARKVLSVGPTEWQGIVNCIGAASMAAGLDLVHAFNLAACDSAEAFGLFDFGRPNALGVVVGNTHKLWPLFIDAVAADRSLSTAEHPLDTYVTGRLMTIVADATPHAAHIVFAHVANPRPFAIQRLAEQVGLAALSPSHLSIHPKYGPWFALRAVIVVDVDGPSSARLEQERPCLGCNAPCVPALERAIATSGSPLTSAAIAAHASDWIAVRDACPVGRDARYGDAQLSYHYAPSNAKLVQGL